MNTENMKPKHLELGIWSFIVNIVAITIITVYILDSIYGVITFGNSFIPDIFVKYYYFNLIDIMILITTWVALGLGIVGLIQKDRKKMLAILGVVFSTLVILWYVISYLLMVFKN
jgi:hypothetical protein